MFRSLYVILVVCIASIASRSSAQHTIGALIYEPDALDAYTLFSVTFGKNSYLIDNCGEIINHWTHTNRAGLAANLLPDGRLLRTSNIPHPKISQTSLGGLLEIYNWAGGIDWAYDFTDSVRTQHHDIVYMENGNILVLAWEYIEEDTVLDLGRNTNEFPLRALYGEAVYEIQPIGADSAAIVWEWHLRDHYVQDFDVSKQNYVSDIADHPHKYDINYSGISRWSNIDWTHCNALDYNQSRDEILINCRNGNEFWIIDHSTTTQEAATGTGGFHDKGGDLIYRWGSPEAYGQGNVADVKLYGAHGLEWIPDDRPYAGSIIAFNNGIDRPGPNYSTVEVITPAMDANGHYLMNPAGEFMPSDAAYTFQAPNPQSFYSQYQSNVHYLPNGNLFTNRGDDGHFTEFDSAGNVVWDYLNPSGAGGPAWQGQYPSSSSVFTATRFPVEHPAFVGKDLTPQGVIELNSTYSVCPAFNAYIDTIRHPSCYGVADGVIGASASGGTPPYEFSIDSVNFSTNNIFNGLDAGNYTITVRDVNLEITSADTVLLESPIMAGTVLAVVHNICTGATTGSIEAQGIGGTGIYTYSIDGINYQNSGLFENLAEGPYTITIKDTQDCQTDVSATVNVINELITTLTIQNVLCFGEMTGVISADVSGGTPPYQYSLDGINFQHTDSFTDLSANEYTITIRDTMGCEKLALASVEQADELILSIDTVGASCSQGATILATATGGVSPYMFTLNGGNESADGIFENLSPGPYEVGIVDSNNCTTSTFIIISPSSSNPIDITIIEQGNLLCFGDTNGWISVSASGGTAPYVYMLDTISNNNGIFNHLFAGNHQIVVTDSLGCMQSVLVELNQPDSLVLTIDTLVQALCSWDTTGMVQISATGGMAPYTYTLNDSLVSAMGIYSGLSPGSYSVSVRDSHDCVQQLIFEISHTNQIDLIDIDTEDVDCFSESTGSATIVILGSTSEFDLIFNGDTTTTMNHDTITFDHLHAGLHEFVAVDLDGCTSSLTVMINQSDELNLSIETIIEPTDSTGGEITLSASGGSPTYQYSVDTGATFQNSPTFIDLTIGNYLFIVKDVAGCLDTIEFIISSIVGIDYLDDQISLVPNPTNGNVNVISRQDFDNVKLSIHNKLGQLIYYKNVSRLHAEESININCQSFSPGVYLVKLQTQEGIAFKQLIATQN